MNPVILQPAVMVNGVQWKLFGVEFGTADGKFVTWIYAVDHGHAALILEEMKDTAQVLGEFGGAINAD